MEFAAVCIGAARGYYSLSIMKKALILLVLHLLMYLLVYFSTVLVIACTGTMLMGALAWAGLFTYSIILAAVSYTHLAPVSGRSWKRHVRSWKKKTDL